MGEGSLSADDIDALLSGGDTESSGSGSSSGDDFDFLNAGAMTPKASGGDGGPSVDDIMAALGPSSAPMTSAPPKQAARSSSTGNNLNLLRDVTLTLTVEFGRTTMLIKDVLKLSEGDVVELDKNVGEDLDILVNGKVIGKGKIIVIDNYYGVRITEIVDESKRIHI